MTIVGKILTILVFLMSLATGAFFVMDYTTRTNWKAAYDSLEKELKVSVINSKTTDTSTGIINNQAQKYRAESEKLKQELIDVEQKWKALEIILNGQMDEANNRAADTLRAHEKTLAESARLKVEITDLNGTLTKREAFILEQQKDIQRYRTEAVSNENLAKATQSRNESLLAQVQDLTRANARLTAGLGGGDTPSSKDPNALNPPSGYVKGTIVKIHADDKGLVEVSVGSDRGLAKNHTLEVYRLQPRPEYLGTIRLLDVREHNAAGRLMRGAGTTGRALQEGDIVASSISPNK